MNPDGTDVRLLTNNTVRDGAPAFSPGSEKVAFESSQQSNFPTVFRMNGDGTQVRRVVFTGGSSSAPSWSPDGNNIAFMDGSRASFDITRVWEDGGDLRHLTSDPTTDGFPAWSPDGTRIAFDSNRQGPLFFNFQIYSMSAEEGEARDLRRLTTTAPDNPYSFGAHWSPDGTRIAFLSGRDGNDEIYTMNAADGSDVRRLTTNALDEPGTQDIDESADEWPAWSPDGTRTVFNSARSGDMEAYTMNAADGGDVRRLTNHPGFDGHCDWGALPRPAAPAPAPAPPRVTAANIPRACASRSFLARVRSDTAAPPQRVTVSLDGRRIRTTSRGSFRVRVPVGGLRPGSHRLTVVAIDAAGNRTRRTFRFRVCAARRAPRFTG